VRAIRASPTDPGRLWSATLHGLYASADAGRSWVAVPIDGTSAELLALAVHPDDPRVLVVGRRDGLWKSADGGVRWTPLGPPTPEPFVPVAVAMAGADIVYASTARHGVFRSRDGGARWVEASAGLPASAGGGPAVELHTLAVDPRSPDTAYAAHERHGVYRTTNGGASWHPFNRGLSPPLSPAGLPPRLAVDPRDPGRVYLVFAERIHSARLRNRLYATTAPGAWLPVEVALPATTAVVGLTVDPAARRLHVWTGDTVWEIPVPEHD
jgi:hypothetical protein